MFSNTTRREFLSGSLIVGVTAAAEFKHSFVAPNLLNIQNSRILSTSSIDDTFDALEYVRSGKLGKVTHIRVWQTDDEALSQPNLPRNEGDFGLSGGITSKLGLQLISIALNTICPVNTHFFPMKIVTYGVEASAQSHEQLCPNAQVSMMYFENPNLLLQWETGPVGFNHFYKPLVPEGEASDSNSAQLPDHGIEFISEAGDSLTIWNSGRQLRQRNIMDDNLSHITELTHHSDMQTWIDRILIRNDPNSSRHLYLGSALICQNTHKASISN